MQNFPNEPITVISDMEELKNVLASKNSGVITIKPKVIFKKIEDVFKAPVDIDLQVPSSGLGSLTMLEATIMASLIKLLNPIKIFEFGTFLGYSTALMVKNSSANCTVFSLDLNNDETDFKHAKNYSEKELRENDKSNDEYLRFVQSQQGTYYLSKISDGEKVKLRLLKGDSMVFDSSQDASLQNIDLVFVDGGHEYDIVKYDTKNAFQMINNNGVIIWHDYNSTIHRDVTDFVRDISADKTILHIQNTMFAICITGAALNKFIQ